jgi:hypothetical protein
MAASYGAARARLRLRFHRRRRSSLQRPPLLPTSLTKMMMMHEGRSGGLDSSGDTEYWFVALIHSVRFDDSKSCFRDAEHNFGFTM